MKAGISLSEARRIAGSLSFPSKLPGTSYGLPIRACRMGSKLSEIAGTACNVCYAGRDQMSWPNPRKAQERRLASLNDPQWVDAMVVLLLDAHKHPQRRIDLGLRPGPKLWREGTRFRLNDMGFHRWHDSGDLQSVEHLAKICEVARRTPNIRHWLPTLEVTWVQFYASVYGNIPDNLVIRISSPMIDMPKDRDWPTISSVFKDKRPADAHICPAQDQDHRCLDCRACWSADVAHVAYRLH